jgi:hypothetical protein
MILLCEFSVTFVSSVVSYPFSFTTEITETMKGRENRENE